MSASSGAALDLCADRGEGRESVVVGKSDGQSSKPSLNRIQEVRATLTGARTCTAAGITATSHAPTLTLCRELLSQGMSPDAAMTVYRNGIVALRIRSIAEAARLTVRESTKDGCPRFALLSGDGAPLTRANVSGALEDQTDLPQALGEGRR